MGILIFLDFPLKHKLYLTGQEVATGKYGCLTNFEDHIKFQRPKNKQIRGRPSWYPTTFLRMSAKFL